VTAPLDHPLSDPAFLGFPLRIGAGGPRVSGRIEHVRELIEQLLLTSPGERVMRPDFGVGVRALVFEPESSALREVASKRIRAALADLLEGEVDPRSLEVQIVPDQEQLTITISYALATIGRREQHTVALGPAGG
jgi:phage baseplate assembly protein W